MTKNARILTHTPIGRWPYCGTTPETASLAMTLVSTVTLSDHEKLDLLRRLDQFRHWRSLDENVIASFAAKLSLAGRLK